MNLLRLLVLLCLVSFLGCLKPITFDPEFYAGDYQNQSIMNEREEVIRTNDPRFGDFACMTRAKIKELERILMTAKTGSLVKKQVKQESENLTELFSKVNQ